MASVHHMINRKNYHSLLSYGFPNPNKRILKKEINKMEFDESKAKKVESTTEYWNPKEDGDSLTGILTSKYEGGFGTTYLFNVDDKLIGTPSHAMLQSQLALVPLGAVVKITRTGVGEKKEGKNAPVLYEVQWYEQES